MNRHLGRAKTSVKKHRRPLRTQLPLKVSVSLCYAHTCMGGFTSGQGGCCLQMGKARDAFCQAAATWGPPQTQALNNSSQLHLCFPVSQPQKLPGLTSFDVLLIYLFISSCRRPPFATFLFGRVSLTGFRFTLESYHPLPRRCDPAGSS